MRAEHGNGLAWHAATGIQLAGAIISATFTPATRFKAGRRRFGTNGCHADRWHGCVGLENFVWSSKTDHGQRCCVAAKFSQCDVERRTANAADGRQSGRANAAGTDLFSGITFALGRGEGADPDRAERRGQIHPAAHPGRAAAAFARDSAADREERRDAGGGCMHYLDHPECDEGRADRARKSRLLERFSCRP